MALEQSKAVLHSGQRPYLRLSPGQGEIGAGAPGCGLFGLVGKQLNQAPPFGQDLIPTPDSGFVAETEEKPHLLPSRIGRETEANRQMSFGQGSNLNMGHARHQLEKLLLICAYFLKRKQ